MKGPTILSVLSVLILRALLCGAQNKSSSLPAFTQGEKASSRATSPDPTSSPATSHLALHLTSAASSTAPVSMLERKECLPLLMLAAGLSLVCALLLLSTFTLTCKVCQMSRRINVLATKSLSCTQSAGGNKRNLEMDAKEAGMLLARLEGGDMSGPQAEREKVQENEEKGEEKQKDAEEKQKDAEEKQKDAEETKEAAKVDESAFPKQQKGEENTSDDPSSHGTEEAL
ncbi:uncharacterized protein LOC129169247 [Dunckerocampus dactyliophorus]|uniref:uncharacterized protein LOC129169247 n=1 Tax=Dunckerocampus dactyliophorus TaxID=161453 RepID=UPI0024056F6B|nr:uncharacterized protein LOC129169247 [Dunckerocampus dactyliophorus]XP_054611453.1 uncharacterized protein LOC129169247 [Dunckerocampus dactyliophorus]